VPPAPTPPPAGARAADPAPDPDRRGPGPRGSLLLALGGWLAGTVASIVALAVLAAVGVIDSDQRAADLPLWAVTLVQLPLWGGMIGATWLASRAGGTGRLSDDVGLRFRWVDLPLGLVAGVATYVVAVTLLAVAYQVLGVDTENVGDPARSLAERAEGFGLVFYIVITLVGAPLAEEIFYRGLVLGGLLRRMGPPLALVLSSVVFGAMHLQLLELPALIAFGAAAAALTLRTGRLGTAIWAHAGFNATAVIISLVTG
jgi:hypothetical protein